MQGEPFLHLSALLRGTSMTRSAFVGTNIETDLPFLGFRLLSMIQFDLTDLRGSCVTSTYSVEDGPKPVI